VTPTNSIIGANADDNVAFYIAPLSNGNFVVASPFWSENRGAATWGDGSQGTSGVVDETTSLVGSQPDDFITSHGIYRLQGGDYAVAQARWSNGETLRVGAITRGDSSVGVSGAVSPQNSVIGTTQNDQVGAGGLVPLPDGGYLAQSELASSLGGITRFSAAATAGGVVVRESASLVGASKEDRVGSPGAFIQADGNIVVHVSSVTANNAGAIALFDAGNVLIGNLPDAVTVRSKAENGGPLMNHAYLPAQATLLVGDPLGNRVVRVKVSLLLRDGFE
jgi:hypothetical protein